MARGGKRQGAGRKRSVATVKTREIADALAADGEPMPLEILLSVMREHYRNGLKDKAAQLATAAAPYLHPRLSAITHEQKPQEVTLTIIRRIVSKRADSDAKP